MVKVRIAVLVISAVAATVVFAGCEDKTTGDEQTLTFTETDKGSHFGLIGNVTQDNRTEPGNGYSLSLPLQDSSKKTVGEINAVCIATQPGTGNDLTGTCSGMADVPGGQLAIEVGGPIGEAEVTGAIVGGTGKYDGATGTFTSPGGNRPKDTFKFTLP